MSVVSTASSKSARPHASSNWLALQKTLPKKPNLTSEYIKGHSRKRRKLEHSSSPPPQPNCEASSSPRALKTHQPVANEGVRSGESLSALRRMVVGDLEYTGHQRLPGKYLALDCEMVGVGIDGAESSLARVSLVNFYGAVQLDVFVRQRERVVDYRTRYSGIRESDMVKARPFDDVQKEVAELLKDRILIGHAVFNDLKALLLSHPRPMIRDTQYYAGKHKVVKSKYVALRNLVKQELDIVIQSGEHSSVTDARATMAVYRIHRKEWEKDTKSTVDAKKRKRANVLTDEDDVDGANEPTETAETTLPGGGRKGVSSGLTTVVRRGASSNGKTKWWKELASSKGSIRL